MRASGLEYLTLVTELLQRARLADAEAGLWEAADLQWWWRTPRRSDAIDQLFWIDDEGPVAGVVLTDWGRAWGCDPIVVPGVSTVPLPTVWARAVEAIDALGLEAVEVLARRRRRSSWLDLLAERRLRGRRGPIGSTWMDADGPARRAPLCRRDSCSWTGPETTRPHPMRRRSGERGRGPPPAVLALRPGLDLAVEAADGQVAGYALFWFDPVTKVGLVEPMRVEDAYQRRGLARAMLTAGLDRLANARGTPPEGRLCHRRGTHALRRRRLPGDFYEQVIQFAAMTELEELSAEEGGSSGRRRSSGLR